MACKRPTAMALYTAGSAPAQYLSQTPHAATLQGAHSPPRQHMSANTWLFSRHAGLSTSVTSWYEAEAAANNADATIMWAVNGQVDRGRVHSSGGQDRDLHRARACGGSPVPGPGSAARLPWQQDCLQRRRCPLTFQNATCKGSRNDPPEKRSARWYKDEGQAGSCQHQALHGSGV